MGSTIPAMSFSKFKLALIQLAVGPNKLENLKKATQMIEEAALNGAQLVALPECFNSPYGTGYFAEYAETLEEETAKSLSAAAEENHIHLIGGSFPEKKDEKLFNTCTVWGPKGNLLAVHRKMHLFDIDIPGKIRFQESATLSPGNELTTFQFGKYCQVGIGICYDIRFAEMAQLYAQKGCQLLVYPGAFNTTTGPAHWELLQRGRAVDNQLLQVLQGWPILHTQHGATALLSLLGVTLSPPLNTISTLSMLILTWSTYSKFGNRSP